VNHSLTRRQFLSASALALTPQLQPYTPPTDALRAGWRNPPHSCRPRTRWWWPGNAVSKEGITQQLTQMKTAGLGGVEIISSWQWYEKGNLPYLSKQHFAMLRHACEQAIKLDLEVALTFGAGWDFGGFWTPVTERSKCLAPVWLEAQGPTELDQTLPAFKVANPQRLAGNMLDGNVPWAAPDQGQIVAVVAARVNGQQLDGDSLTAITDQVSGNQLRWQVPEGTWRIGVFRLQYTGQPNSANNFEPLNWCIDHFNPQAMRNYVAHLGGIFAKELGRFFGHPIDSFFADSFEIAPLPETLLWSNGLLAEFQRRKGYDLTRYLPLLWLDAGPLTPRVRYDVNEFLHQLGKEVYYDEFNRWCAANKVQARIQPHYRFTTELIEGAGLAARPETEVCTARFETIADPRKATAAGARFYGRAIVSAEAYTFLHPERYRTTLAELKRATDAYLRDGVTQLYNHGWTYTEEPTVAPARDMPWANRIQPWMPWFKHYRGLSDYISRSCWMLRQGQLVADVLIYAPQATAWSQRVIYGFAQRRQNYGNLPKTLVANGYDYDLVNDDLLQNRAVIGDNGTLTINQHSFRILILPGVKVLPLASLRKIEAFAQAGGTVIALEHLPQQAGGLRAATLFEDTLVSQHCALLFNGQRPNAHYLKDYQLVEAPPFSPQESPYSTTPPLTEPQQKLLSILRSVVAPDCALAENAQSDGLCFIHKRAGDIDIYFLANLQPAKISTKLTFRQAGKRVNIWDALTGEIRQLPQYTTAATSIEVPLTLDAWHSLFLVFQPNPPPAYITRTDLATIEYIGRNELLAFADRAGEHSAVVAQGFNRTTLRQYVNELPEPITLKGRWDFTAPGINKTLDVLASWTASDDTRHLAGEGVYELRFTMPPENLREDIRWLLDLGAVADTAEVTVNLKRIGVSWLSPHVFDITRELKPEENRLRIAVTNSLHNHVAGLAQTPALSPPLQKRFGAEASKYREGAVAWQERDKKYPLLPAGLLGPVRLIPQGIVVLRF
jgi:hypothetical protein